jgi:hypothetical protein
LGKFIINGEKKDLFTLYLLVKSIVFSNISENNVDEKIKNKNKQVYNVKFL